MVFVVGRKIVRLEFGIKRAKQPKQPEIAKHCRPCERPGPIRRASSHWDRGFALRDSDSNFQTAKQFETVIANRGD
jgi:predicted transcriptional regulator